MSSQLSSISIIIISLNRGLNPIKSITMIISVYLLVLVGVILHLWYKNVIARSKPGYHWKIFWWKMWEAAALDLVCGWILTYALVDSQWDSLSLWVARIMGIVFGWAGSTILNSYIKNGEKYTELAKEKFNLQ